VQRVAGKKGQAKKHNQLPFRALVTKDLEMRQIIISAIDSASALYEQCQYQQARLKK
jgi:hypothetical protein